MDITIDDKLLDTVDISIEENIPEDKKLVCFGAGTAVEIFLSSMPQIKIDYITDNNPNLWGKTIKGVSVVSPHYISKEDNIFVLVLSRHVIAIKEQLDGMGFVEYEDYIDIYTENKVFFRNIKYLNLAKKYTCFLKDIDPQEVNTITKITNNKIGVVLAGDVTLVGMLFSITLYLIMKSEGYDTELIIDFTCEDYLHDKFIVSCVKSILLQVEKLLNNGDFIWINENDMAILDENDYVVIEKGVKYAVTSYIAYCGDTKKESEVDKNNLYRLKNDFIKKHYRIIKKYLENNNYDTLSVFNGIVDKGFNYMTLGKHNNIRVSCYDTIYWSTDYPSCWNYDNKKIMECFSEDEKNKLAEKGEKIFNKKCYENYIENEYDFKQRVPYVVGEKKYNFDILIPLNIMFDSAVFGLDRVFETPEEWFVKTVRFLAENNMSVAIKESPNDPVGQSLNWLHYDSLIADYIDGKNIIYFDRKTDINIYNLIQNSKVILPYSSSVGIEAAILNKAVIIHTNCCYQYEDFVINTKNEEDYLEKICLMLSREDYEVKGKKEALAWFYMFRDDKRYNNSIFNETSTEWFNLKYNELKKLSDVRCVIDIIGKNKVWYNNYSL